MTSRERVLRSLNWKEPDRAPIQVYLTPEVEAQLSDYFGGGDLLEHLGVDLRGVAPAWKGVHRNAGHVTRVSGVTMSRGSDEGVTYDIWGAGYRRVDYGSGYYDEAVYLPLAEIETLEDVERYPWPSPDDYDYSIIPEQCARNRDFAIMLGDAGTPDILNGVSRGRGMEQVVTDIALRDPVGLAIIDRRVDFSYEVLRRGLEAARGEVDVVALGEDTGNQNGRMFSPKDFEGVFRPRLQCFIDLAHQYGAKAMMHSCGDTHEIMPMFIEMGLDVLDAMQPEPRGMDPETIRAICKGKLAFCGLISTQSTLPFGTEADCRAEARHRLDVIASGGGYIFAPAHCIQPGTPLRNVLAAYEEALGKRLIRDE